MVDGVEGRVELPIGYFNLYWPSVIGPTGVILTNMLTECWRRQHVELGTTVELDPVMVGKAIGVGADRIWQTLQRCDRVSPITLEPVDGMNVVTIPVQWPFVKRALVDTIDQTLESGWPLVVQP